MAKHVPSIPDYMLLGRTTAAIDLIGRTGARLFELAFDDETGHSRMPVMWHASARFKGARVSSQAFPFPAQAAEDLLARVIDGGQCKKCERTTIVGVEIDGYCCFMLQAGIIDDEKSYRYVRSCEI